jgi:signal transduction histidine kinase
MPTLKFSWYDGIALMLFCSIVLFVILILLLKVLLKKYVLPLEVLNQFIEKILHHNYTSHIKTKASDEIAQLAQNLNRLSLYLQNLETTSKAKAQSDNNLIIKTAYKLHTPLKELKHDIHELAQKKSNIPESYLKQMQKNIDKLDMIANNLLDLSQLDNKDFTLQKDLLNLIEILQDSIKAREKVAKEQNIKIDLKISLAKEIILFTGNKNRLKQMFCETLDKALQIYPQKSDLIIKILEDDNNYYIYMQNNNDEISVEHLPEMFPQFYQTAEDDTILNSIELKIAQHLASLHQIKLTTEKQSDKYTVFKFTISK